MTAFLKNNRLAQTERELDRLKSALKDWQDRRREKDTSPDGKYRGQHESQLQAVVAEIGGCAEALRTEMGKLDPSVLTVQQVYAACARLDRQVIWTWRAWGFFREKFDQRDDPALEAVLRAADEVVWSCYRPFFKKSNLTMDPAPLPFIDPNYSPVAIRRSDSNQLPKEEETAAGPLKDYFAQFPIPLLRLPTSTVTSPWALVLIGHEIGHFIQPIVEPNFAYQTHFREQILTSAQKAGGSEKDQQAWGAWAPEIFADWYSILTMGQWAAWAIGQFERLDSAEIMNRRTYYPSPGIRLLLLSLFADRHGLPPFRKFLESLVADVDSLLDPGNPSIDAKIARQVASDLYDIPLPGNLGHLRDLVGLRPEEYQPLQRTGAEGEVAEWASDLQRSAQKPHKNEVRTSRLVTAGTAQMWSELMISGTELLPERVTVLNDNAIRSIISCAEAGARAAKPLVVAGEEPGVRLSKILMSATDDEPLR